MKPNNNSIYNLFCDEGCIFMNAKRTYKECNLCLFGVPYDGTTSFRPGARFGPSAIREVSQGIETYCPQLNLDLEDINFTDLGSLKIGYGAPEPVIIKIQETTKKIYQLGIKQLMLGGEHSITAGAIKALIEKYPDLILLQLDAHADLRDTWLGTRHSHACVMKRSLELLPSEKVFQLGIRSGTQEEFKELRESERLIEFQPGQPAINLQKALDPMLGKPIYLTLDLDWFDPSILPGTGTPEPGGFFWNDFAAVIDILINHNLIGADIVELAPNIDSSGISSILAAKVTRSLIMLLNK